MGAITSNIGLITGIPITDTVEKLVSIHARPRDALQTRTEDLKQRQVALSELSALLLSLQLSIKSLGSTNLFQQRSASSSHTDLLSVTVSGTPAVGTRQFTPLKLATSHQLLSNGVSSATTALGGGTFSFGFGGFLDRGVDLDLLNGGAGFDRGSIEITDRSGASAEIDLRFALTVDDVLNAINSASDIDVTAVTDGDAFRLIDNTGQTTSNLIVSEVNGGQTATALGLAGIDIAANEVSGADVISLGAFQGLDDLNDGRGVDISSSLTDLQFDFRDGTTATIDFRATNTGTLFVSGSSSAANGADSQVNFAAVDPGTSLDGVTVVYVNDDGITAGSETVDYNSSSKILTVNIDEGNTLALNVTAAIEADPTVGALFRAGFAEGSTGTGIVDVTDTATLAAATEPPIETTLGDIINTLNTSLAGRLRAEISAGGDGLTLTDLTQDLGNTFSLSSPFGTSIIEDLGLQNAAAGDVITGSRIQGGLQTVLLSTLNGGNGIGPLGSILLQDRNGGSEVVDFSAAETLDEVLNLINASSAEITASINSARNGIQLVDTSGGTGTLFVVSADANASAEALGISVSDTVSSVDSGSLHRQFVSERTQLSDLNGGGGVAKGRIKITNTDGAQFTVRLDQDDVKTIGDAINEINATVTGAIAQINDTGDGIVLVDTAEGAGTLRVEESGATTAKDLRLLGEGSLIDVGGEEKLAIDGATTVSINLAATDTLEDLVEQINDLSTGQVQASIINDGTSVNPYRVSLSSQQSGQKGEILLDISGLNLNFTETAAAADAVLLLGPPDSAVPILAVSEDNSFQDVIDGVTVTINQASLTTINVNVTTTNTNLVGSIQAIVETYNKFRDQFEAVTEYNSETNVSAVLQGETSLVRVDAELSRLLSGSFFGAGEIQNLATLGLSFTQGGKIEFDKTALEAKLAADRSSVEEFFTSAETGFVSKLEGLLKQLAGEDTSLLTSRIESINRRVEDNEQRLLFLDDRLEGIRQRLLNQFIRAESAIGKIQSSLDIISTIVPLRPLSLSKSSE